MENSTAYKKGWKAWSLFLSGSQIENPYPVGSENWMMWSIGFDSNYSNA